MPRITVYLSEDVYYMLAWWAEKQNVTHSRLISQLLEHKIVPELNKEIEGKKK